MYTIYIPTVCTRTAREHFPPFVLFEWIARRSSTYCFVRPRNRKFIIKIKIIIIIIPRRSPTTNYIAVTRDGAVRCVPDNSIINDCASSPAVRRAPRPRSSSIPRTPPGTRATRIVTREGQYYIILRTVNSGAESEKKDYSKYLYTRAAYC